MCVKVIASHTWDVFWETVYIDVYVDGVQLNEGQRGLLKARYLNSGTKRAIETHLLNFMSYNYYHLPMYAKPGMTLNWTLWYELWNDAAVATELDCVNCLLGILKHACFYRK